MAFSEINHQNSSHCNTVWPVGDIPSRRLLVASNALSFLVGLTGNLLLMIGLVRSKLVKQNTMKVIFSLAVSDLAISTVVTPMFIIITSKYGSSVKCVFTRVTQAVNFLFGINTANTLLILSVDRVLLISWPKFYRKWITAKVTTKVLVLSWVFASTVAVSTFFLEPYVIIKGTLITAMMYFAVSVAAYTKIIHVVRKHMSRVHGQNAKQIHDACQPRRGRQTALKWPKRNCKKKGKRISFRLNVEFVDESQRKMLAQKSEQLAREITREDVHLAREDVHPERVKQPKALPRDQEPIFEMQDDVCSSSLDKVDVEKLSLTHIQHTPQGRLTEVENPWKIEIETERKQLDGSSVMKDQMSTEPQNKTKYASFQGGAEGGRIGEIKTEGSALHLKSTSNDRKASNFRRDINVTWTVGIVIITLFLCYIPFVCTGYVWVVAEYKLNKHASILRRSAYAWTLTIAYLHSGFNPLIIIARNGTLRRSIKSLVIRSERQE